MPEMRTEDLIESRHVAEMSRLCNANSVSMDQHRYDAMPRPLIELGRGRFKMWLRPDIEAWTKRTGRLPGGDGE